MDINKINYLKEFQFYLKKKFDIDVNIVNKDKFYRNTDINLVFIKLFLILFFLIIFIILFVIFKKKFSKLIKNNLLIKIIFYFVLIFLILYSIKHIIINSFKIYFYYKSKKLYKDISIEYNDIEFNTGDILQEATNWDYYNIYLFFLPLKFLHNSIIIKFKNRNFMLHYTHDAGYPANILKFNDTKLIEICLLDDYLKDNYNSVKYYRLFKTKKIINNDSIFEFLKNISYKDLKFSFMINIKEDNTNTYHCMSFLLKILNSINIIPKFNFQNFTSDDLIYLPELSKNIYDKPFMFEYIPKK